MAFNGVCASHVKYVVLFFIRRRREKSGRNEKINRAPQLCQRRATSKFDNITALMMVKYNIILEKY